MENQLEFKSDSSILCEIFEFYQKANMDLDRPALDAKESLASLAGIFIDEKTREIKEKGEDYVALVIKDFNTKSFFDTKAYTRNLISNEEFFRCVMWCSGIKENIYENISPERKAYNKRMESYGKLERKVSPPLEAYKYVPFNKMNIKYSNKSYGLLFE